jgi:hypothetical protein
MKYPFRLKQTSVLAGYFHERNLGFCVVFCMLIKLLIFAWQVYEFNAAIYSDCHLAILSGDSSEYLQSALTLYHRGIYFPDAKMPGYSLVITLFYWVLPLQKALDALVITQVLTGALSVVYLARTAFLLTGSSKVFRAVLFIYCFSTYVSVFDKYILAESLSISTLIFSVHYFVKAHKHEKMLRYLLIAGAWAAVAIFIRPALLVILFAYFVAHAGYARLVKNDIRKFVAAMGVLFLPFLITDGAWILRNKVWHQRLIPFMNTDYYSKLIKDTYYMEELDFVKTWGGDIIYWNPTAEIRWFGEGKRFKADNNIHLPAYIYTTRYNYDSLEALRNEMRAFESNRDPVKLALIRQKFQSYATAFRTEKPLLYHLVTFKFIGKFVFNGGGTYNLFNRNFQQLRMHEKLLKLLMMFLYEVIAIGGCLLALVFIFILRRSPLPATFAVFIICSVLMVGVIYRHPEFRYFAPLYPGCVVICCIASHYLWKKKPEMPGEI